MNQPPLISRRNALKGAGALAFAVSALEAAVVLVDGRPAGLITRQDVLTFLAAGG
jgi:hypothetical protein